MTKAGTATYVYCLVQTARAPRPARGPSGLPGMGRPRLLDAGQGLWIVCATAPLDRYGEKPIEAGLRDLDWVSRCAVAHEAVIERFLAAEAVVPLKLFTLFKTDARALDHFQRNRRRLERVLDRLAGCAEWGVRVTLDEAAVMRAAAGGKASPPKSGAAFLLRKKQTRDAALEVRVGARQRAADLYERIAELARDARQNPPGADAGGVRLLLDAAYLVPARGAAAFRKQVQALSKSLGPGFEATLSGPWPPYHFVGEP